MKNTKGSVLKPINSSTRNFSLPQTTSKPPMPPVKPPKKEGKK